MEYDKAREILPVETPSGKVSLLIGGTIDRMDLKDGTLRVVDYKTGGTPSRLPNLAGLFEQKEKRSNYIFQAFLYCLVLLRKGRI